MNKKNAILILTAVVFIFVGLNGCEEESPIFDTTGTESPEVATVRYFNQLKLRARHQVGDTSCPQKMGVIRINRLGVGDMNQMIPDADSVSVESMSPSIHGFFGSFGNTSMVLADSSSQPPFEVEFNCAKAESVNSYVAFNFFSGGVQIATDSLGVQVDVFQ